MTDDGMIEPTGTSPGSDHVTLRELEQYQKAQANEAKLLKELVEQARASLEKQVEQQRAALEKQVELQRAALEKQVELARGSLERQVAQEFESREQALLLQTRQYDIHLEKLNHEQARLLADRERYLQKEVFEPFLMDTNKWRDQFMRERSDFLRSDFYQARHDELVARVTTIERTLASLAGRDHGLATSWGVMIAALGLIIAIAAFVVARM